jgi:hypothetical protein
LLAAFRSGVDLEGEHFGEEPEIGDVVALSGSSEAFGLGSDLRQLQLAGRCVDGGEGGGVGVHWASKRSS